MKVPRSRTVLVSLCALVASIGGPTQPVQAAGQLATGFNCSSGRATCTEVADSEQVFGEDKYIGHDEPSTLFYSSQPGSGNRMRYLLTLPKDPPPAPTTGRSYNFQLHPAFWFGMALCDTQSAPHPSASPSITCTPDSDSNITTDAGIATHPGTAFMEMQFYPPGWVAWPPGNSCDATKWCGALNIDSLSQDYFDGTVNNADCLNRAGIEPVNFAFVTRDGRPTGPPNPVDYTASATAFNATFTPDLRHDLLMNSGDTLEVTLKDTPHGLRIDIHDLTTGQYGFMTASAINGFAQVKYDPSATTCSKIPYDFHPMYSTTSENTRVPWAAHSYNIAFADEIGHFDFCNGTVDMASGLQECVGGTEGSNGEPTEGVNFANPFDPAHDDWVCFPASASTLVQVQGCLAGNGGFDGVPYQNVWPDGNPDHPTSIGFTSPVTGQNFDDQYQRVALEADLPRIEIGSSQAGVPNCNRTTGAGCSLIPQTDDNVPANFYPFFSTASQDEGCVWNLGNDIPGVTSNDFGKNSQYGPLLKLTYPVFGGHGAVFQRYNDFRNVMSSNPCLAGGNH
jgi:hypothetical protein